MPEPRTERLADAIDIDLLAGWIDDASGGDAALRAALAAAMARTRRLHASFCVAGRPGEPAAALLKVFRAVAALLPDGRVRSTEFFRIADTDAFFDGPRGAALAAVSRCAWDDRASLFTDAATDFRLTRFQSLLNGSADAAAKWADTTARFLEYFLNADLRGRPDLAEAVLEGAAPPLAEAPVELAANRRLLPSLKERLLPVLQAALRAEAEAAISDFRGRLDPLTLEAMRRTGVNGCRWHNWMAGYRWEDSRIDAAVGLRRRQALAAFPLAHCLVSKVDHPVNAAAEDGTPLVPALAAALGVDEKVARRLNGIGIAALGLPTAPDQGRLAAIVARVARLPDGRKPNDDEEWGRYFAALRFADAVGASLASGRVGRAPTRTAAAARLLASAAGRWGELDKAMLVRAADGFKDMAADLLSVLVHPALLVRRRMDLAPAWDEAAVSRVIVSGRTLTQVLDACSWWHGNQAAARARLAAAFPARDARPASWPGLHEGEFRASNGLLVVCLTSQAMLDEEHRRMGHCVNTYGACCLYDGVHVLSIRTADGALSLSTAEIDQHKLLPLAGKDKRETVPMFDTLPVSVAQHKASGNDEPPTAAKEALWEYVSRILSGSLKIDAPALAAALGERTLAARGAMRSAPYDPSSRAAVDAAWEEYSVLLPARVRKRGLDRLVLDDLDMDGPGPEGR